MKPGLIGRVLSTIALVCALAGAADATDFIPAPNLGNVTLDLDTQDGNYSGLKLKDIAGVNAIRATIKIHRLGQFPNWGPAFFIAIYSDSDKIEFRLVGGAHQPLIGMQVLHLTREDLEIERRPINAAVRTDQGFRIAIDWTANGLLAIHLPNGETQSVALK